MHWPESKYSPAEQVKLQSTVQLHWACTVSENKQKLLEQLWCMSQITALLVTLFALIHIFQKNSPNGLLKHQKRERNQTNTANTQC